MAVGALEVEPTAAVPIVEFAIPSTPRRASERQPILLDATEDSVELSFVDVESIVMGLERSFIGE
jgi:hypothetical protein